MKRPMLMPTRKFNPTHLIIAPTLAGLLLSACTPGDEVDPTITSASTSAATSSTSVPTTSTTADTDAAASTETGTPTGSGTTGDSSSTTNTDTDTDTDTDTGTGDDTDTGIDPACQLPARRLPPYYTGNASYNWADPVDELCTVAESTVNPENIQLVMDCPIHAMQNDGEQVQVSLQTGPMPGVPPQVGEDLHVFYQLGGDDVPRPGLLFLHRDDQLIYFAVNGFFVFQNDVNNANKYSPPLSVNMGPGPCPPVDNPAWTGAMTGFVCEREALAVMEFIGSGPAVSLPEGMSAEIPAGDHVYAVDVRLARMGENCGEIDGKWNQTVAGALMAP